MSQQSNKGGKKSESSTNPQLPIREYLDANLMSQLTIALKEATKQKPQEPIEFIARFMLEQNAKSKKPQSD